VRTAAGGLGLQRLQVHSFGSALWAVVVISLLNLLVRPILVVLTLPVTLLTVGLFLFVINGLMFWAAANLLSGLSVSGFWAAVWAASCTRCWAWSSTQRWAVCSRSRACTARSRVSMMEASKWSAWAPLRWPSSWPALKRSTAAA
jgi:putative membrane protein